jgi:hypothetical protein
MNNIQKRFILFLVGCMGARSMLVYLAKTTNKTYLRYMGYILLIPAIGFIYLFASGSRKTGQEVFGDTIWWNSIRPIHALLYIMFSYNAIMGNSYAWIYLLVDLIIGLSAFLFYHFTHNNFRFLV